MIIFVGDKPSKKNKNIGIPFVGTQSYKRLLDWIWQMDINVTDVHLVNANSSDFSEETIALSQFRFVGSVMVALGNSASKFLDTIEVEHFKLPHPSGRNLKLNDKEWLTTELNKCKRYLNE